MRETQILRGLHKARAERAGHYADGMVPAASPPPTSFRGIGKALGSLFTYHNPALDKPAAAPAAAPAPTAAPVPAPAPAQTGISGYVGNGALDKRMAAAGLSRGTAYLHGPGTGTSDSIPAMLSKGEAVLPAKTVQKVGAGNLARLIHQTNGKPPKQGLRAGVHAVNGAIPNMAEDLVKRSATPSPVMSSMVEGLGGAQTTANPIGTNVKPGMATPTPAPAPAAAVPEPAPTSFADKAKNFVRGAPAAAGEAATGFKAKALALPGKLAVGAAKGGLALAPVMGAYQAVKDTDENVRKMADSTGLDYDTDSGRAGANVVNFLEKTGNAATFGLAGALGRGIANKINGESFFGPHSSTPSPAAAPAAPAAAPAAPANNDPYAAANAAKLAAANDAPRPINVTTQPNGVPSFSDNSEPTGNAYTGPGAAGMRRGNFNVMPALPTDPTASSRDNAIMAANLRDGVDIYRGTSQAAASADNSPQGLLMQSIQGGLARGQQLTPAGVAALQGLNTTDKNYKASMYGSQVSRLNAQEGHGVTREGNELTYRGTQNRLGLDRQRMAYDIGQAASKGVTEDNMNSPFATQPDEKGIPQVNQARANELGQYLRASAGRMQSPDGTPVNLEQLRASNPQEYQRMRTAAETQYGLGKLANTYASNTVFGQSTGWGAPKISGVREMGPSDWLKGSNLTDAALAGLKPGYYSQGVELDLGGRKQVVPLGAVLSDPNGGQYRELVNQWLKANGRPILGNMATGE